jgi:tetratricopeptide (TPR) repeat protein
MGLLLLAATLVAYQHVWQAGFIWDDGAHITSPSLRSWHGLRDVWFKLGTTQQYYPLVHTFFWVEYKLWGDAPLGYHLVNVLLHVCVALMLVAVLRQLEIPGAWLAGFLFALHPVEVESVAWVSELKNTLSAVFSLGSALAYLEFDRRRKWGLYALSLALFSLGLFAKTVIATLPAALLLILWWRRKHLRWKEDVVPTTPFFVAGLGMGLLTAWMERTVVIGKDAAALHLSLMDRFLISGRALWFYLEKLAWPQPLLFIYPRWEVNATQVWQFLFPLAALLLLLGLWALRHRIGYGPLVALLFFAGTLFPALGFFDVFPFRYSFVADHFQYLAGIGPLVLLAAGLKLGSDRLTKQYWAPQVALSVPLLLALGMLTWQQCRIYANEETLWQATILDNPRCWMAQDNLGLILLNRGQTDEAISHFRAAVVTYPDGDVERNDLAAALIKKGLYSEAVDHLKKALAVNPQFLEARKNLALAYWKLGQMDLAETNFRSALEVEFNDLTTLMNLGRCLNQEGKLDGAERLFASAVQLFPSEVDPLRELAEVLDKRNQPGLAIPFYQRAVALAPKDQNLLLKLGAAYVVQRDYASAEASYRRALQTAPADPNLHYVLGGLLQLQGQKGPACREMEEALRLKPDFWDAQKQLLIMELSAIKKPQAPVPADSSKASSESSAVPEH